MELIKEMESCLPIPAHPSKELRRILRKDWKDIDINTELEINAVFDSGDVGGIVCRIIKENNQVFIASLTHLRIKPDHPLSDKMSTYQKQRIKRISKIGRL